MRQPITPQIRSRKTPFGPDLVAGLFRAELWKTLAIRDIANRYQRSFLGPLWITISTLVFILAVSFMYSTFFGLDLTEYLPYLAVSYIGWVFLSTFLLEMSTALTSSLHFALNIPGPLSVYFYRILLRNLISFAHNVPVLIGVMLVFGVENWWPLLLFPVMLLLVSFTLTLWGIPLAILSARLRDVPALLGPLLNVAFFVTPVMWQASQLPESLSFIFLVNPFYWLLEPLRATALGYFPDMQVVGSLLLLLLLGAALATLVFRKWRHRVEYWL